MAQPKPSRAFPTINAKPVKRARKDKPQRANKRLKPDIVIETTEGSDTISIDEGQYALDNAQEKLRQPGQIRTPPPEPPASVQAAHALIPPEADDPLLRDVYEIHAIAVVPSSKMQDKVRRVLSLLAPDKSQEGQDHKRNKSIIVALISRESGTNKCISIAEIAKRELERDGGQWRQYTGSWSRLETLGPEKERRGRMDGNLPIHQTEAANNLDEADKRSEEAVNEIESCEDEEGFEQMAVPDRKLVRNVACLVIYLSRQAVPRLKELYGSVSFPMFNLMALT